jgi:integrase
LGDIFGTTPQKFGSGSASRRADVASVEKRIRDGNVSWLARWRDPDGRQRKKTFTRKIDAERFLVGLRAEIQRGTYLDPDAGKVAVAQWSEQWANGLSHLKETTRSRYLGILRVYVVPKWGPRPLSALTHGELASWIAELSAAGLAPGTVRQIHRVVSLMLDLAVRDGRLGRNPAAGLRMPRARRAEPVFLTPDQLARLVRAAGEHGTVIQLLALTGLRFGELAALRVGRVDLSRRRLVIAESVSEIAGTLAWSSPKTHQTRSVPIPPSLVPVLVRLTESKSQDELVFSAPRGGPIRARNWRARVFDPAAERAGLSGVTPHDLRHTAASLAVSAGANVKAVQRMLGHASAAMTLDVYAGLFGDDLDDVAQRLDRLVPPLCPEDSDKAKREQEIGRAFGP